MGNEDTRERLLNSAVEVFAEHGYAGASTRDICRAAEIGNASIHYHFGDKAAIYRELFERLLGNFEQRMRAAGMEQLVEREALLAYYRALMRPLSEDPGLAKQIYLHMREEFQPSGIVDDLRPRALQLQFELLGGWLQRELGIKKVDGYLQRLVLALQGIALSYVIHQKSIALIMPSLTEGTQWLNRLTNQVTDLGWAMVEAERTRRNGLARR